MKAAKTEALKGLAMGPMALRPFAGEGLVAVGGLPEARGGRRGRGRRGAGVGLLPGQPPAWDPKTPSLGEGGNPRERRVFGNAKRTSLLPHPGTTRLFIPVQ